MQCAKLLYRLGMENKSKDAGQTQQIRAIQILLKLRHAVPVIDTKLAGMKLPPVAE